ncbi:MAG: flagellar biosynthetic protein FliQ [Phycisphaerales bacterium]|nr:flagellar biosynthetic protein FliQ [Phycisphaerales bacterium]
MLDFATALDMGREALIESMIIAGPVLVIGLLVGLLISLVQTVTQLHDQTLAIVPKIVAMLAATILLIPWVGMRMIQYTQNMLAGP